MSNEFHVRGAARRKVRSLADELSLHYGIGRGRAVEILYDEFDSQREDLSEDE